jgi:hypothetical protein
MRIIPIICRHYFVTATLSMLSLGAAWGTWILWQIGLEKSFTAVSVQAINPHGHAQIYGWVGFALMGIVIGLLPQLWGGKWKHIRRFSYILTMAWTGLLLSLIGQLSYSLIPQLFLVGQFLQWFALIFFAVTVFFFWKHCDLPLDPSSFLIVAAVFLLPLSSLYASWHHFSTLTAPNEESLLWQIATYQAPLRDIQVHGMALLLILGIGMRLLPPLSSALGWTIASLLCTGLVGEVGLFLLYRHTGNHHIAAYLWLCWAFLAIAVMLTIIKTKIWRYRHPIRYPLAWLVFSFLMLLLLPLYQRWHGSFSHAYYGAIRHAITVGFVSLFILILISKMLGLRRTFLGPIILLNVGCLWRVTAQILTDWNPLFFTICPVSGLVETSAIAWWAWQANLVPLRSIGRQHGETAGQPSRLEP